MASDEKPDTLGAYIDAALALQGLVIDPTWRDPILANMTTIETAAKRILAVPIDDEIEAAPIFTA